MVARPLEEMVQEVHHARVGPLQVLDHHDHREVFREALEEEPPAREELLPGEHLRTRQTEQLPEARGDVVPVGTVGNPALEAAAQTLGDDIERVLLADLEPRADHLRQGPVAHALPVGQAASGVPQHVSRQPVDVLEELPGETGLTHPGDSRDEHHPRRLTFRGGVEELLYEAELVVPPDEGRLEDARALGAGYCSDDPGRLG